MSDICARCVFWIPRSDDRVSLLSFLEVPKGWRFCARTVSHNGCLVDANSKAGATDSSEYHSALMTSPEYGCNQFKVDLNFWR